ncbi:MAG: PmoA family protein [Candidatus Omnitrophica bacterium]|nr:PmoA family protein [Candidatus Omnitrophota bacterium]MCM8806972.1 PmoA family protein [Candidatus Omnitrophota bacterium]
MGKIIVKNSKRDWYNFPLNVEFEKGNYILKTEKDKFFAQSIFENGKNYIVFLPGIIEKEEEIEFKIEKEENIPENVKVVDDGKGKVDVFINETLFTTYNYSQNNARPFLNPVIGPSGKSIVRKPASPENIEKFDHIHHRGIWVAHGDVNGIDNWSELEGHGKTIHRKFLNLISGPVFGLIHALSDWVDNKGKKILEEERIIKIYNLPFDHRIIDHILILRASETEVVFKDTKESGLLSIRVHPEMEGRNTGIITNSYGATGEKECWGKRSFWVDYSGQIEGVKCGVSIFDHPSNLRYPTYWHVRDYGLFSANFFGLSDFYNDKKISGTYILPYGEELKLFYRIYIHSGDCEESKIKEKYLNFLYLPEIEVK